MTTRDFFVTLGRLTPPRRVMGKPILCVDFDGVIHSYSSGWKGPRNIPDKPVPGALEWLLAATRSFRVAVYSSRSHHLGGRRAMQRWMAKHLTEIAEKYETTPEWWRSFIAEAAFADPWEDEACRAVQRFLRLLEWPRSKPAAFVSIDDRAICFNGTFPSIPALQAFRPWWKP